MDLVSSETYKVSQILPSYLFRHLEEENKSKNFIEMVVLEFWCKDTQQILKLANTNFSFENVLIEQSVSWNWNHEPSCILNGKYRKKREKGNIDLSHIKRVKSSEKDGNVQIVITSSYWLKFISKQINEGNSSNYEKKLNVLKVLYELTSNKLEEEIHENIADNILGICKFVNVPDEPITIKSVHKEVSQEWPTTFKIGEIPEIIHNKGAIEVVKSMCEILTEKYSIITTKSKDSIWNEISESTIDMCKCSYALLYNPKTMKVCWESTESKIWSIINHPIMRLFEVHGEHLWENSDAFNNDTLEEAKEKNEMNNEALGQYFAKDLWLFSLSEPWYM